MKITQSVMDSRSKKLPVLDMVLAEFEELNKRGFAEKGIQSIIEWYKS